MHTKQAAHNRRTFWWGVITLIFLVGILATAIVNLATAGTLNWALFPIGSIGLAWVVITPLFLLKRHRLLSSLVMLSALIMPFLRLIGHLTMDGGWVWPVAFPIVCMSLGVLWLALILFMYTRIDRLFCTGLVVLAALCVNPVTQVAISLYTGSALSLFSFTNVLIFICVAVAMFARGVVRRRTA